MTRRFRNDNLAKTTNALKGEDHPPKSAKTISTMSK